MSLNIDNTSSNRQLEPSPGSLKCEPETGAQPEQQIPTMNQAWAKPGFLGANLYLRPHNFSKIFTYK